MSDTKGDYGFLLNKDIKLHRTWFKQMTELIGVNCTYYALKPGVTWDRHGDLDTSDLNASYLPGKKVGCIFQEYPDQKTLKKMGWVTELQEGSSIIHVPYDLEGLQVGCLVSIPSGLDTGEARLFRIISMQTIMIYPAAVPCEIAPEYIDLDEKNQFTDTDNRDLGLLKDNYWDD